MIDTVYAFLVVLGLAAVTLLTRCFFLIPGRPVPLPTWLQRGLNVAPLAALVAVIVPEVVMTQGHLIATWHDARLPAVAAATAWYALRPGVLGPMLAGLVVFVPLRLALGW